MPAPPRLSILTVFPERKVTLGEALRVSAMCWAASIFLIETRPGPLIEIASAISLAASASPSALRTAALVSSSLLKTTNLARSALC